MYHLTAHFSMHHVQ